MSDERIREIGLDEVATASFRPSAETDDLAKAIKDKLGFGANYLAARLAIARSLALSEQPQTLEGEVGSTIKGSVLFGTGVDLATWIALVVERAGRSPKDLRELQSWIGAHWTRGMGMVATSLSEADGRASEFWRALAEAALPTGSVDPFGGFEGAHSPTADPSPVALSIPFGEVSEDSQTNDRFVWQLNGQGGSPHSALMGGVGSGKTRTACYMLRSVRQQMPVPLLAFDFKGDMSDDRNALHTAFNASVLSPPHDPIPLDVLALSDRSSTSIGLAAQRLRDSLSTLKGSGFGALQKSILGDAAEHALKRFQPCKLSDVRDTLIELYQERGKKEDGAVSSLVDLCRFPLFSPELSPSQFFSRSWVIRLSSDLPDLVKVSVVTLMTDALDRYLNSLPDAATDGLGNRALRVFCVIDEAHRILGSRLPGLSGLIRLSRSKGGAVMLISQSPDDFSGEDDEFLNEMGLVGAFRTNADARSVKRILGPKANLAAMNKGEAWVKLGGDPTARKVISWS